MKIVILILLINLSFFSFSQSNIFPQNMNRDVEVSSITVYWDCYTCKPKINNELINIYYFNKNGLNYQKYGYSKNEKSSKQIYKYYDNGYLKSYSNFSTHVMVDNFTHEFKWDSTQHGQTVEYYYSGDKITRLLWKERDKYPQFSIDYKYKDGLLIQEQIQYYEIPGSISFSMFKPNSAEFLDSLKQFNKNTNRKDYKYVNDTIEILYYTDGIYTGKELLVKSKNNRLEYRYVFNENMDTLSYRITEFNDSYQKVKEDFYETGYDAFGNGYDFINNDRIIYFYNEKKRLVKKDYYFKDKLIQSENLKYTLK